MSKTIGIGVLLLSVSIPASAEFAVLANCRRAFAVVGSRAAAILNGSPTDDLLVPAPSQSAVPTIQFGRPTELNGAKGPVVVEGSVGSGQEGVVMKIHGRPDLVIKVDHFGTSSKQIRTRTEMAEMLNRVLPENTVPSLGFHPVQLRSRVTMGEVLKNLEHQNDIEKIESLNPVARKNLPRELERVFLTLAREKIAAFDFTFKNIKVDPITGRPTLVDLASFHHNGVIGSEPSIELAMEVEKFGEVQAYSRQSYRMYKDCIHGLRKKNLLDEEFRELSMEEFISRAQ